MINIIKNALTQPFLFIFSYPLKKVSFFVSLLFATLILIGIVIYSLSFSSFDYIPSKESITEKEKPILSSANLSIEEGASRKNINNTTNNINTITIKKGDTLFSILKKEIVDKKNIQKIIKIAEAEKLTLLKVGKKITFKYQTNLIEKEKEDLVEEQKLLSTISFEIDSTRSIDIVKSDNNFSIRVNTVPLTKLITKYETSIDSNVISSLKKTGLSSNSIINLINTYSHKIDFQRQIHPGDKVMVITEKFVTPDNKLSHHGKIIYASIKSKVNEYTIYGYSPDGKKDNYDFFSKSGETMKGTLLKTPVKVVRISSKFGYRKKHPVHGYGAMHKGVDFAAPVGTEIYAAGDGIVEFIGWKSGYGRIIIIKHNKKLSTAYAHASRFAKGLKRGTRVRQGDIIAFVGTSGNVTGPHVHFETRENGVQINPEKYKSTPNIQLSGNGLKKFNKHKDQISSLILRLDKDPEVAASDIKELNLQSN